MGLVHWKKLQVGRALFAANRKSVAQAFTQIFRASKSRNPPALPLRGRHPSVHCPGDSTRKVIQIALAPCSKTGRRTSRTNFVISLMSP